MSEMVKYLRKFVGGLTREKVLPGERITKEVAEEITEEIRGAAARILFDDVLKVPDDRRDDLENIKTTIELH
jgi:hypothetical protein